MKKTILAVILAVPVVAGADTVGPLATYLVEPCRLLDTREEIRTFDSGALVGLANRRYLVQESCGVPLGARAAVLNVTVTGATVAGHLALWRADFDPDPVPNHTSNINFGAGSTVANGMTVRLAEVPPGQLYPDLWVFANATGGEVHVIIDVIGFLQ